MCLSCWWTSRPRNSRAKEMQKTARASFFNAVGCWPRSSYRSGRSSRRCEWSTGFGNSWKTRPETCQVRPGRRLLLSVSEHEYPFSTRWRCCQGIFPFGAPVYLAVWYAFPEMSYRKLCIQPQGNMYGSQLLPLSGTKQEVGGGQTIMALYLQILTEYLRTTSYTKCLC